MLRRRILGCVIPLLTLLGVWALLRLDRPTSLPLPTEDPRLTFSSPYENARPEVQYVGDAVCAHCHPGQAATFRLHPMGRSLAAAPFPAAAVRYDRQSNNPFIHSGLEFRVERCGERLIHREERGPTSFESQVEYAIGSGSRASSFLINREGYLFQSALTWYTHKAVWDLSPGFAANPHSDRLITTECLFCHCNQVDAVPHTLNRYREPIFRGLAIGCERCHGPGQLHVFLREHMRVEAKTDWSIVNPGRLPPALREAVCQQCHLQGEKRILRRGRQPFDFRPGLPLNLFWSIFVRPAEAGDEPRAVGQVEQMYASRCYRGTDRTLGCISCHDAHALPAPSDRVRYYRDRCLACHRNQGCRLSPAERRKPTGEDNCILCHMPPIPSADVAHTAVTDHRLRRRPEADPIPEAARPGQRSEPVFPLIRFTPSDADASDEEAARDQALALVQWVQSHPLDTAARRWLAEVALPPLEVGGQKLPLDVAAWQGRGHALQLLGRKEESLAAFEGVLAEVPTDEETLISGAALLGQLGRREKAIGYWKRALAVNPWIARYHYELARLLVLRKDWAGAAAEGEVVVRLHPFHTEARHLLLLSYVQLGDRAKARAEFETLRRLNPALEEALLRDYGRLLR
jgi:hypothetical protein